MSTLPETLPERQLQRLVWKLLSDPARVWHTASGKRLQILAPGELNVHEGPDFLDMVLLLDGAILVGDGEFHRSAAEWRLHGHARDPRYRRVLLHIVLEYDPTEPAPDAPQELLQIPVAELHQYAQQSELAPTAPVCSIQDLQYFALIRLLRHTAHARHCAQAHGFEAGFLVFVADFLQRYAQKRRRPVHSDAQLQALLAALPGSALVRFVLRFGADPSSVLPLALHLQELLRVRIGSEGRQLRQEIVLNCVLPYLLAHAAPQHRVELLAWYWSVPARTPYGILRRRFPELPQHYMWQQQGMLEFLRQGGSSLLCRELLESYRFGDVLEFYRTAELLLSR
jgi:hypothetical protein